MTNRESVPLSSPSTSELQSSTEESGVCVSNRNQWSYLEKYFEFTAVKGKSLEFKCVTCAPKTKIISANNRSMYNLKLHVSRVHGHLLSALCIKQMHSKFYSRILAYTYIAIITIFFVAH